MIAELKALLAECHVVGGDRVVSIIKDASIEYIVQRLSEEVQQAKMDVQVDVQELEKRLKLIIQLANLARYKLVPPKPPKTPTKRGKKAPAFSEGQP